MADDTSLLAPTHPLDIEQILQEAHHRWLQPVEICEILRNHHKLYLTPHPPDRPPAGSLFLFDSKVLCHFRKDGHCWKKKKDGKSDNEAHEKLKAGSIDALHCYHDFGDRNESFQRRCYWMLDEKLEHIVLVHYREVKEMYRQGRAHSLIPADRGLHLASLQASATNYLEQSPSLTAQASYTLSLSEVDWGGETIAGECGDAEPGVEPWALSPIDSAHGLASDNTYFLGDQKGQLELSTDLPLLGFHRQPYSFGIRSSTLTDSSVWPFVLHGQKLPFEQMLDSAHFLSHKLTDARLLVDRAIQDVTSISNKLLLDYYGVVQEPNAPSTQAQCQNSYSSEISVGSSARASSLTSHMQLDADSLVPFSQKQLFSISDFVPKWAFSGVETKMLVAGTFLGGKGVPSSHKWCCMFGEIEVSAEVMSDNAIRCQVPFHTPGRVPFYITCSNRLACSEIREFEYQENPSQSSSSIASTTASEDEVCLLIQFTSMISTGLERKWLECSDVECDKCQVKTLISSLKSDIKNAWGGSGNILDPNKDNHHPKIQNLLKDKLYDWLVSKTHEEGKGPDILDDKGQGIIHLAAALGYDWSLGPIIGSGVSPNFRDAGGKTALHWASQYGREKVVVMLLKMGAAAGAVDDPTPVCPAGQTAADLAWSRGHRGIAGYLAEADLTSHVCLLTVNKRTLNRIEATMAAEKAHESAAEEVVHLNMETDEELSGQEPFAAVKKSAHAAALIQAAFRARSFCETQLTKSSNDVSEAPADLVALCSLHRGQKISHFEDYLHSTAIRIQQKYRGWQGRRDFLKMRNRLVKIKARIRGHQVLKHYKKVIWAVGVVEKVILRWRRRKPGLRGFRSRIASQDEKGDEYDFKRISRKQKLDGVEKALARVQSMVRHAAARDQYMRLVAYFESCKVQSNC